MEQSNQSGSRNHTEGQPPDSTLAILEVVEIDIEIEIEDREEPMGFSVVVDERFHETVRARIEATEAEQELLSAAQVAILNDMLDAFARRLDAYETRRAAQARKDAEEQEHQEQEQIQRTLDQLPDPDDPDAFLAQGELTMTPASEPSHEEQLAALDQGALPNELQEGAPADPGNYPIDDPADLGHAAKPRNVLAQPTAISLNED